ncbi:MAG: MotA/TolQ/ExbB proton channel family protein [Leptospirales bacterium]|nr:MotA/TolQ/ExbB proton channel family protein [Leptospirales bacterium]
MTYGEYTIFSVMIFASILALAVGIEKALLYSRLARSGREIFSKINVDLGTGNTSELSKYVEADPRSVYARFASFIKENYYAGENALSYLMDGKMIEERIFLEKRLVVLASLGNNAPFIGLLGTVFGIIKAFYNLGLGSIDGSSSEIVMKSIATALVATAGGLLIAIPVVIANNYFNKKLKVIMQNLEQLSKSALAGLVMKGGR